LDDALESVNSHAPNQDFSGGWMNAERDRGRFPREILLRCEARGPHPAEDGELAGKIREQVVAVEFGVEIGRAHV
jgi:hypothetical protein